MYSYPVYGIDLGSSNSCISVYRNGKLEAVEIEGDRTVPSCIAYTEQKCLIGKAATKVKDRSCCIIYNKRIKGRLYVECQDFIDEMHYPFEILCDSYGYPVYRLRVGDRLIKKTPVEVDIDFLRELIRLAVEKTGIPCKYFVVTYPAFFDERQKSVTQQAAASLGPDCKCIGYLPEPVAAAEASNLPESLDARNVLVYDFGGGTFDVCILESQIASFTVKQYHGDTSIGGCDIDNCIFKTVYKYIINYYNGQKLNSTSSVSGLSKLKDHRCLMELRSRCEEAKIELSSRKQAEIDLSMFGIEDPFVLSRRGLEKILDPFVQKSIDCCEQVIQNLPTHCLGCHDSIILVGGTSRIPYVKKQLKEKYGVKVFDNIDPDVVVSFGATRYGISLYCQNVCPDLPNPFPNSKNKFLIALHDIGVSFDSFGKDVNPVITIGEPAEREVVVKLDSSFTSNNNKLSIYSRATNNAPWKFITVISLMELGPLELIMMIDRNGMLKYQYKDYSGNKITKTLSVTRPSNEQSILCERYEMAKKMITYLQDYKKYLVRHSRRKEFESWIDQSIQRFFATDAVAVVDKKDIQDYAVSICNTIRANWNTLSRSSFK